MVLNELIADISVDLGIFSSLEESQELYLSRLIYSALGEWVKTAACDIVHGVAEISDEELSTGASKHHITKKIKGILDAYISNFPEIKDWFFPDENAQPAHEIRNRLISSGQLVSDKENRLQFPPEKCCKIADDFYLLRGYYGDKEIWSVGLGVYVADKENIPEVSFSEFFNLTEKPANEFLLDYVQSISSRFKPVTVSPGTREYFNPYSFTTLSKSWESTPNLKLAVTVYRDNQSDYGFIRQNDGKLESCPIPSAYIKLHDIRRFLYGLRYMSGNPLRVRIKEGDYRLDEDGEEKFVYRFRFPSHLPQKEMTALYSLGWPVRNINDKTEFLIPESSLHQVKYICQSLCMEIKYE